MTTLVLKSESENVFLRDLLQVIGASIFIALVAQFKLPLPFTPVPISLQNVAVMLVGGLLGSRKGTWAVICYFGQLCAGLPVQAGGVVNPLALIGPTGGYLLGFAAQAYVVGWFYERRERFNPSTLMLVTLTTTFTHLFAGAAWLGFFVGLENAFWMGCLPFIPGAILKNIVLDRILNKVSN